MSEYQPFRWAKAEPSHEEKHCGAGATAQPMIVMLSTYTNALLHAHCNYQVLAFL